MPAVIPAELWQESGRWDKYGRELLRLKDRYDRDFCFGPTHEEVVTDLVRREVRSYRDLPKNLYQIQVKFRDEVRPRFGLMRGREFIMKDAYSFHVDARGRASASTSDMYDTYTRIFERCGLTLPPRRGGHGRDRRLAVARVPGARGVGRGRDRRPATAAATRPTSRRRRSAPRGAGRRRRRGALERVATPGKRTVEEVSAFLGVPPERFVKTLVYQTDGGDVVVALVRGDHELSETKLQAALGGEAVALADEATVERVDRRAGRLRRARSGSTACASSPTRRCAACAAR